MQNRISFQPGSLDYVRAQAPYRRAESLPHEELVDFVDWRIRSYAEAAPLQPLKLDLQPAKLDLVSVDDTRLSAVLPSEPVVGPPKFLLMEGP